MSYQQVQPCARMCLPPMPTKLAVGRRWRRAAINSAPSRSPESSPARIAISGAFGSSVAVCVAPMLLTTGTVCAAGSRVPGRVWPGVPSARERALATFDERQHEAYVGIVPGLHGKLRACLGQRQASHVKRAIGALDGGNPPGIEAAALQPLAVDAAWTSVLVVGHGHERQHVVADQAAHADEGVDADLAELVHAGIAGKYRPVADLHVPGQGRIVGEHHVAADLAVMRDVHVGQHPVVVAQAGDAAAAARTAVDGDEFADQVAVADDELGALAGEFLVLWITTERGELGDAVVAAYARRALDHDVGANDRALADFHFGAKDAVGTNTDVLADHGRRVDLCAGVDHWAFLAAHINSQLATSLPSTLARATNRPMPRITRFWVTSRRNWSPGVTMALKRALSTLTR